MHKNMKNERPPSPSITCIKSIIDIIDIKYLKFKNKYYIYQCNVPRENPFIEHPSMFISNMDYNKHLWYIHFLPSRYKHKKTLLNPLQSLEMKRDLDTPYDCRHSKKNTKYFNSLCIPQIYQQNDCIHFRYHRNNSEMGFHSWALRVS